MRNIPFVFDRYSFVSFRFIAILSLALFFSASCKKAEAIEMEGLFGRWDIIRAEKNGKETSYLRNGYFKIDRDGMMTVNLTGEDENGKYTVADHRLIMEGDKIFTIEMLRNDSLNVKYVVSPNTQFLIYLLKKKEDAQ